MKLLVVIEYGEMCPRFYGRAYTDVLCKRYIVAPVPLNWIIGCGRELWFRLTCGPRFHDGEKYVDVAAIRHDAYYKGWDAAFRTMETHLESKQR